MENGYHLIRCGNQSIQKRFNMGKQELFNYYFVNTIGMTMIVFLAGMLEYEQIWKKILVGTVGMIIAMGIFVYV